MSMLTHEDKRKVAMTLASVSRTSQGSADRLAYDQKKEEHIRNLNSAPEHEKIYHEEERNKQTKILVDTLSEFLIEKHSYELKASMFDKEARHTLVPIISSYIEKNKIIINGFNETSKLVEHMTFEICGLGPIDEIIEREEGLNEIWINGLNPITGAIDIYYEKKGKKYKEEKARFRDQEHANDIAKKIARNGQQKLGTNMPLANVRYPDGRVNIVQEPVATGGGGPYISFRIFPKDTLLPEDLVKSGSISEEMNEFMELVVRYGGNSLFAGGTGSGKTTLLTAFVDHIPDDERIILMEDVEEARIRHKFPDKHIITEECKFNTEDPNANFNLSYLTRNAMRQKPDYMLYGEVRDGAAYDMLNGGITGHKIMGTAHSRSAPDTVQRLINMVQEHGSKMDTNSIGKWITQSLDIVYFQMKYEDNVRRASEIIQLEDFENGKLKYRTIFKFVKDGTDENGKIIGRFYRTGRITRKFAQYLVDHGAPVHIVKRFLQAPEIPPVSELFEGIDDEDENDSNVA
ncbi:CpaF family protein [Brevibacillus sp. NPDC003359]|uniref:CpaF family protein n=1 Tax=unclassified Brevibacillus TaxID=2684853 RepID=UPI0036B33227